MHLIQAILMGIVQGLSEFLPISSSAHLVFTSNFYKVFKNIEITHSNQEIFLDIMLHLGTLIAVLIYFRKEIWAIVQALFVGLKTKNYKAQEFKIGIYIILGTIITVLIDVPKLTNISLRPAKLLLIITVFKRAKAAVKRIILPTRPSPRLKISIKTLPTSKRPLINPLFKTFE